MQTLVQEESPPRAPYASFGGGCFWCLEAEFRRLPGVIFTRSGFEGGRTEEPTHDDVSMGKTGHAETTEIYYDPKKISYRDLLHHFLKFAHDPTELNRQGIDVGTQYRSVIFYHDDDQKKQAQDAIAAIEAEGFWKDPIQTTLEPQSHFWPAAEEHQQYYEKYEAIHGMPHVRYTYKLRKWARQA